MYKFFIIYFYVKKTFIYKLIDKKTKRDF